MKRIIGWIGYAALILCGGCNGIALAEQKPEAGLGVAWLETGPGAPPSSTWLFGMAALGLCAGLVALALLPRAIEKHGLPWKNLAGLALLPHRLRGELALLRVEAAEDGRATGAGAGPAGRRVFPIKNATTRIGRAAENDIVFAEEKAVSRHHAVIEFQGGSFRISEVMSIQDGRIIRPTYGTFVNGVPISGNLVYLKSGDVIQLGKHLKLRFQPLVKAQVKKKENETRTIDHRTG